MHWVYILKCSDGSYYTGSTSNPELRVAEHNAGTFGGYTAKRLPVALVFSQGVPTKDGASRIERQIKGWSRRKKEAIMAGDWGRILRTRRSFDTLRMLRVLRMLRQW